MTDVTFHHPVERDTIRARVLRVVSRTARAIDRMLFAHRIRHDLTELPNRLRRDIGLMTACRTSLQRGGKGLSEDFARYLRLPRLTA